VASYPFTTLRPYVGVVEEDGAYGRRVTVADLPGLVAGAAANVGLGHFFLRHVERTRVLALVVDCAPRAGGEGHPYEDLRTLEEEMRLYDAALLRKCAVVFANKVWI
jgi:GTPase